MVDIDAIEENEARIFSLRLDPANFPSADMQGEVVKENHEADIIGTHSRALEYTVSIIEL